MRRKLVPAACLCAVSFLTFAGNAQAVPGLSSSSSVKEIVKMLKSYSGTNAANVYQMEQDLKQHPTEAAEALVNVLDTNDEALKKHVAQLLQRISSHGDFTMSDDSIKTVVGMLKSCDMADVQSNLVLTLGNIGPKNDLVKQAIIEQIKSNKEVQVRKSAVDALAKLAREERPALHAASTAALIEVLKNDDSATVRGEAASALGNYRDNPPVAIPALILALDDNYLQVRTKVVCALSQYGRSAQPAIPKLIATLKGETDQSIRSNCIYALRNAEPGNPDVLQVFLDLIDEPSIGQNVVSYMVDFGPRAAPAVPKLITILKSGDRYRRQTAARALSSIGSGATEAIPALTAALQDTDASVRRYAEEALRNIQPQAQATQIPNQ